MLDNIRPISPVWTPMDQQPENVTPVDTTACAGRGGSASKAANGPGPAGTGKRDDDLRTALIPASVISAKAAAAKPARKTMPAHLPLYAASLCVALGVGGVLGGQFVRTEEANDTVAESESAKIERALPWKRDVAVAQNHATAKVRDDLKALRGEMAALRTNNEQLRQSEGSKHVQELRALRSALEAQKAETASLKADLAARFDRSERDAVQRTDRTVERVDRLEKRLADPTATGSLAKPAAKPEQKAEPRPEPRPDRPAVHGMVLREVDQGVALIETKRGLLEVMRGDPVPGAGRVEAIEKHAGKWRVVTTTGIIDDKPD